MQRWLLALIALTFLIAAPCVQASNDTLQLTIVDNTGMDLQFTTATAQNPGNSFTLKSNPLDSSNLVIEGLSTQGNDLAGNLHFSDKLGHEHVMVVIDPRNKHIMQPLFSMHNKHLYSTVVSKTRGESGNPNGLFLAGAIVRIDAMN
jgi:hypothetical protein